MPAYNRYSGGHLFSGRNNNVVWISEYVEIQDENGNGTGCWRPIVTSQDLENTIVEMQCGYECKSFSGFDTIIRPISLDGDQCFQGQDQCFPKLAKPDPDENECQIKQTQTVNGICMQVGTPTSIYNTLNTINWDDLNPVQNPQGMEYDHVAANRSNTPTIGHDYEIMGRCGNGEFYTPEDGLIMPAAGQGTPAKSDYADDYRLHAIKGPPIITGWGYSCDGYPVPNAVDNRNDLLDGTFSTANNRDRVNFFNGHLRDPFTWFTAPLDLRADLKRGVWTVGGCADGFTAEAMLCVSVCENVAAGAMGLGNICDGTQFFNEMGIALPNDQAVDFLAHSSLNAGTKITVIKKGDCYEQVCNQSSSGNPECPDWTSTDECINMGESVSSIADACNIFLGKNLTMKQATTTDNSGSEPVTTPIPDSILISAGICVTNTDDCIDCAGTTMAPLSDDDVVVQAAELQEKPYCTLEFGKGLCAIESDDDQNTAQIGLSLCLDATDDCIRQDDDMVEVDANQLQIGKGLCLNSVFDNPPGGGGSIVCTVGQIGLGVETVKSEDCVTNSIPLVNNPPSSGTLTKWCCLELGKNLCGDIDQANGTLTISAGVEIVDQNGMNGTKVEQISVTNPQVVNNSSTGCSMLILPNSTGGDCPDLTSSDTCVTMPAAAVADVCNLELGKNLTLGASGTGSAVVSAGMCITESNECVDCNTNPIGTDPYCSIDFASGLCATEDANDPTSAVISLNLPYMSSDDCIIPEANDVTSGKVIGIEIAGGLCSRLIEEGGTGPAAGDCGVLEVGVGIDVTSSDECVTEDIQPDDKFCSVEIGENLSAEVAAGNELRVSSHITIEDKSITTGPNEFKVRRICMNGADISGTGDCQTLTLNDANIDCEDVQNVFQFPSSPADLIPGSTWVPTFNVGPDGMTITCATCRIVKCGEIEPIQFTPPGDGLDPGNNPPNIGP